MTTAFVKTTADSGKNCGGGLSLALATLVVGLLLFVRPPVPGASPLASEWIEPEHLAAAAALGLVAAGFWMFRRRFWSIAPPEGRRFRHFLFVIMIQAALLRLAVEAAQVQVAPLWVSWPSEPWLWMPWFLSTGIAAVLLGARFGALACITGVLLLYLRADPGPPALMGCLAASLTGIVMLRRSPTRSRVLRAGMGAGIVLGIIAAARGTVAGGSVEEIAGALAMPILTGIAGAFLLLAILPALEWALNELSDITLAEYGSDHPLLDQLKEQAPGTWHHTLNVADLAEKAAAAIGARALFCRTAVFFHDIGKLKEPGIFAENINGPSPHDDMTPEESARRIIEHVTYGLELARKHRLPRPFREIIAEHHGTTAVRFFYAKARAQLGEGGDPDSLKAYFYPGPPPSSRESGIIALADMVEAATRSLGPKPETEVRAFVRKLIAERVAEGTLSDCPLTMAELAKVEESFAGWLRARNHQRPAYPETSGQNREVVQTSTP